MKNKGLNPFLPVVLFSGLLFIFFNSWVGSIVNSDDAIYSEIIKQILKRGDWLNLYWQDYQYLYKPPFFFWLGALSVKIFSLNEFALRFPSALLGFMTVLLVFFYSRKVSGNLGGYISAMVLLSFELFLNLSRRVMMEVPLTFFITLSLVSFLLALENRKYFYLAWISAGFAFLMKGYAFFPAILAPAVFFILFKKFKEFLSKESLVGFSAIVAIILPWQLYNYVALGSGFFDKFIKGQVLDHYAGKGLSYFVKPFYYYFERFFELDLPLTILFIFSLILVFLFRKKLNLKLIYFYFIWILSYLIVYSFSKSKLDHYIVGIYPAMALIIGMAFSNIDFQWKRIIHWLLGAVILVQAVINFLPYLPEDGWLVDSTGDIKRSIIKFNETAKEGITLYIYKIYLPAPVFYSKSPVIAIEPDSRRYDLLNSIDEFRKSSKIINMPNSELGATFMNPASFYLLIKNKDLEELKQFLPKFNLLDKEAEYSLISN